MGCGANGTDRHQLIFQIGNGKCTPLQVFQYKSRCDHPPDLVYSKYSNTFAPTAGGSAAPVQSTFGPPYQKDKMYSIEVPTTGEQVVDDDAVVKVDNSTLDSLL